MVYTNSNEVLYTNNSGKLLPTCDLKTASEPVLQTLDQTTPGRTPSFIEALLLEHRKQDQNNKDTIEKIPKDSTVHTQKLCGAVCEHATA